MMSAAISSGVRVSFGAVSSVSAQRFVRCEPPDFPIICKESET